MRRFGEIVLNPDSITYAQLNYRWVVTVRVNKKGRQGLPEFDHEEKQPHTGVRLLFAGGGELIFDDLQPETADLVNWLCADGERIPGLNEAESELVNGLPEALRAAAIKQITGG